MRWPSFTVEIGPYRGPDEPEEGLMTTEVIARPARMHRRHPRMALAALVLVAVVVAGIVALTSEGADDTPATEAVPVASTPGSTCAGDGGALLAAVGSMP